MADHRFSALATDPRYRLPSRKEARTAVDPRFKRLFTDQDFSKKAKVDRYGRKIKADSGKKELERLYQLDPEKEAKPPKARKKKPEVVEREVVGSSAEEDESEDGDEDEDEDEDEDLQAKEITRDLAREGFSESSSEEESSEEESDEEADLVDETAGGEQTENIPMGEVTRRIAAVNLDWDNIRAQDLMAVAQSFVPTSGRVQSVTVYPSEFGRERIQREELEGPPKEIFADTKRKAAAEEADEDEDSEEEEARIKQQLLKNQTDDGEEFDTAKLRQYQLERLRYYYSVIECDKKLTAKALYDAMDGREYLTTANFFDLRFVPDDTSFDDDTPRDECTKLPNGYKPNDFRTEALTHSKVRLTWDDDDTTRKEVQKRAFSRAEMDENDLQAYIGSGSDSDDSVASRKSTAEDRKAKKQQQQRERMRGLLGLGDQPAAGRGKKDNDEPVGDMQVTFSSGLSKKDGENGGVFENEPQDEESTRDRYIRKERDRKQKRKEKMKAARAGGGEEGDEEAATAEEAQEDDKKGNKAEDEDNDPFNDPFFTDPAAAAEQEKAAKRAEKQAKRDARAKENDAAEARKAELELLMAGDRGDEMKHFNMKEIQKAEKEAKRKGKKGKKNKQQQQQQQEGEDGNGAKDAQGFSVDAGDERFKALFESHDYAIDPTNARFKGTEGMKMLLEEGRKKRKNGLEEDDEVGEREGKKARKAEKGGGKGGDEEIAGLLTRLKGRGKGKNGGK